MMTATLIAKARLKLNLDIGDSWVAALVWVKSYSEFLFNPILMFMIGLDAFRRRFAQLLSSAQFVSGFKQLEPQTFTNARKFYG